MPLHELLYKQELAKIQAQAKKRNTDQSKSSTSHNQVMDLESMYIKGVQSTIKKLQKINRSIPVNWYAGAKECGVNILCCTTNGWEFECNIHFYLDTECLTKHDNSINVVEICMDNE